jgi:hypothetical protein
MLDRMYPAPPGFVARLQRNVKIGGKGSKLEIDAVLNNVTDAVLFEIKAAWLREDAILDDSPGGLTETLCPDKQTISEPVGTSHLGQERTSACQCASQSFAVFRASCAAKNAWRPAGVPQ